MVQDTENGPTDSSSNDNECETQIDLKFIDKKSYSDCWIWSNCYAINLLINTITKYNMKCVRCFENTFNPAVKIIESFEWDEIKL